MLRRLVVLTALVVAGLPAAAAYAVPTELDVNVSRTLITEADTADLDVLVDVLPEDGTTDPLAVEWRLQRVVEGKNTPVTASWTAATAVRSDAGDPRTFAIGTAALSDGRYLVEVRTAGATAGSYVSDTSQEVVVDRVPLSTMLITGPTEIFPFRGDNYRDNTTITISADQPVKSTYVVRRVGTTVPVRTVTTPTYAQAQTFRWWGTDDAGARVPAGDYEVEVTSVDDSGVDSATDVITISVSDARAVWRTWTRTLTPRQADKQRFIGACATLRGEVNGWSGGYGFWSNYRCGGGTGPRSFVEVAFGSSVPTNVLQYGDYSVTTTGRANGTRPTSEGGIALARFSDETFPKATFLPSRYGAHPSHTLQGRTAVHPSGFVQWNFFTGKGHRYDVRRFTVRLETRVLVDAAGRVVTPPATAAARRSVAGSGLITSPASTVGE